MPVNPYANGRMGDLFRSVIYPPRSTPEPLTPKKREERDLTLTQIRSLGNEFDADALFGTWTNAELQELLELMIVGESGKAKEAEKRKSGRGKVNGEGEVGPSVTVATHIPGDNDLMSGVLPPRRHSDSEDSDFESTPEEIDDPTVSIDTLPRLYRSMPNYMVSVKTLKTMNLFKSPAVYETLPKDFFTTIKGLKRAWDEANAKLPDAADDMDGCLLEAVLKRGGIVENAFSKVAYPRDITPQNGSHGDPDFWDEIWGTPIELDDW